MKGKLRSRECPACPLSHRDLRLLLGHVDKAKSWFWKPINCLMQQKSNICSHAVTKVIKNSVYVWHVLDNLCRRRSDPSAMVAKVSLNFQTYKQIYQKANK